MCDPKTYLGLLALLEESLLRLLLGGLVLGEVVRCGHLLESGLVNTTDVNALAGGDHIAGVNPAERDTVDLEGTGNEENTLVEVLEEDDTLATETAGKEDQNGTGLEALADLSGTNRLADLFGKKAIHVRTKIPFFHCNKYSPLFNFRRPVISPSRCFAICVSPSHA